MISTAYSDFHRQFLELEAELELFALEIDGLRIWERIRHNVAMEALTALEICGTVSPANQSIRTYARSVALGFSNLVRRNPLFASQPDVLCFGRGRRNQRDGEWWDDFLDPVHESIECNSLQIESAWNHHHHTPERTEAISYVDFIDYVSQFCRQFDIVDPTIPPDALARLDQLEWRLQTTFGVTIDVRAHVRRTLTERAVEKPLYDRLLSRLDPELAFVVVHGSKLPFIESCHEREIPVVELQHGQLSEYSYNYSFEGDRTKTVFPDYLLTFGTAWERATHLPLPSDRVRPVGYPYLNRELAEYETGERDPRLLFISTRETGPELSKLAVETSRRPDCPLEVTYKLHPDEMSDWQTTYPWLRESAVDVIDSRDQSLYELFAASTAQVGVCSTAIYEGLAFGLDTYLVELPTVEWLSPLLETDSAVLVDSAAELVSQLSASTGPIDREQYFAPNAADRLDRTLEGLLDDATCWQPEA